MSAKNSCFTVDEKNTYKIQCIFKIKVYWPQQIHWVCQISGWQGQYLQVQFVCTTDWVGTLSLLQGSLNACCQAARADSSETKKYMFSDF